MKQSENSKSPAFVVPAIYRTATGELISNGSNGLTKREYFAAIAMLGLFASGIPMSDATISEAAIKQADNILKELGK